MENEPHFEDDRLRVWRQEKGAARPNEADRSVLEIDFSQEEVFESRVYSIAPEAISEMVRGFAEGHPEATDPDLAAVFKQLSEDPTLRIFAKQRRVDKALTFVFVARFADIRALLHREDLVPEPVYRRFVGDFEQRAMLTGAVGARAVIELNQWREYERRSQTSPPKA